MTACHIAPAIHRVLSKLQFETSKDQNLTGIPSGLKGLDRLTKGWHAGQLIVIAARPGMGKSSLMQNAALHAATKARGTVAFFSMEMTQDALATRFLAMDAQVEVEKLKEASRQGPYDWKRVQQSADSLCESRIFLDDSANLSIEKLKNRCRAIKEKLGLSLVLIDYIQLMRGVANPGEVYTRKHEVSSISRGLKAMAKELQVPVIVSSQLSREAEKRVDGRPKVSDLRESGAIEGEADTVLLIHREKNSLEKQNEAELIIAKHLAGDVATLRISWDARCLTFHDLER